MTTSLGCILCFFCILLLEHDYVMHGRCRIGTGAWFIPTISVHLLAYISQTLD